MSINTLQLRAALQTGASNLRTGWEDRTGEAKVENLNLKNVYLSKEGNLHVSNSGWARMWASLRGRDTGETALRHQMGKLGIERPVIDRAMQRITEFKQAHAGWQARRNTEHTVAETLKGGAAVNHGAGAEPSRDLEGILRQAHTEEVKHQQGLAARKGPVEAGKEEATAFVQGSRQSANPLGQLESRLQLYQNQLENARKADARPDYQFKVNSHQAQPMRALSPQQEIARLQASIGVLTKEIEILRGPASGAASGPTKAEQTKGLKPDYVMRAIAQHRVGLGEFKAAAQISHHPISGNPVGLDRNAFENDQNALVETFPVIRHVLARMGEHFESLPPQERLKFQGNPDKMVQQAIAFAHEYHQQNPVE